jgi:nucleotide-binding universal stress UspA family protein
LTTNRLAIERHGDCSKEDVMRVLLAIDGSATSVSASQLVGSLRWPEGTIIEVVAATHEPPPDVVGTTVMPLPGATNGADPEPFIETALADAVEMLRGPGRIICKSLLAGRPASVIVDRAGASRAELVVVGSRGLGPLKSMLLGSVSAEVVDHAPCPVLVVRRPALSSVLLAVDGSASAGAAVTFVRGSHFLAGHPVEVFSVAPSATPPPPVTIAGVSDAAYDSYEARIASDRERVAVIAAEAVEDLRAGGLHARWSISQGNPAHEIIEAARSFGSDLIVLGSRGHTGLTRIVLGSIARNVLLHTHASVLIVREPQRVRTPEPVEDAARVAVGRLVAAGLT